MCGGEQVPAVVFENKPARRKIFLAKHWRGMPAAAANLNLKARFEIKKAALADGLD